MTQQTINIGSGELTGDGESLRSAFQKINNNFTELYTTGGPSGPRGYNGSSGPRGYTGSSGLQSLFATLTNNIYKVELSNTGTLSIPSLIRNSTTGSGIVLEATGVNGSNKTFFNSDGSVTFPGYLLRPGPNEPFTIQNTSTTSLISINVGFLGQQISQHWRSTSTIIEIREDLNQPIKEFAIKSSGIDTPVDSYKISVPTTSTTSASSFSIITSQYNGMSFNSFTTEFKGNSIILPSGNGVLISGGESWGLDSANQQLQFPNISRIRYGKNDNGLNTGTINVDVRGTDATFEIWINQTGKLWRFSNTGEITFPDNSIQQTAFNTSTVINKILNLKSVNENFSTVTNATGVITHDVAKGSIFYHDNISGNFITNLINLNLSNGNATNLTLILNQGNTGFITTGLQIAGVSQTINWQGSTSAPSPTANKKEIVGLSILNNDGSYIVFGQLSSFG